MSDAEQTQAQLLDGHAPGEELVEEPGEEPGGTLERTQRLEESAHALATQHDWINRRGSFARWARSRKMAMKKSEKPGEKGRER